MRLFLDDVQPLTYFQQTECRKYIDYEITKYFINRLPKDIYIKDRSGLLTKIISRIELTSFTKDCLHVCEKIQCQPEQVDSYTKQARATSVSMRQHMHKVVLQNWQAVPPVANKYSVEVLSSLTLEKLEQNDGIVYLEEHDIVVFYGLSEQEIEEVYHPYSLIGYTERSYQRIRNDAIRKGDFTFNVRIVDNIGKVYPKWLLVGDVPFCVIPVKDPEIMDGIYVTYSKNTLAGEGPAQLFTDRFDISTMDQIPYHKLYNSEQEALFATNTSAEEKARVQLRELEIKAKAVEHAKRKAEQDLENLEKEIELRRLKNAQEQEKIISDREKHQRDTERAREDHRFYYEKQEQERASINRKNTVDIIRYVPIILTVVMSVVTLLTKKK